jgi:putative acetyltransferase
MFLRPYRPSDKRQLQQLFFDTVHTVNAHDYTPEQLMIWAPTDPDREIWARLDTQHCFIVEYQKIIVGFTSLTQEGWVDLLYVHKDFQGRGIASNLLKQLERLAKKKGFECLTAEASITALGFFEKAGFKLLHENKKLKNGLEFRNFILQKSLPQPATKNTQNLTPA